MFPSPSHNLLAASIMNLSWSVATRSGQRTGDEFSKVPIKRRGLFPVFCFVVVFLFGILLMEVNHFQRHVTSGFSIGCMMLLPVASKFRMPNYVREFCVLLPANKMGNKNLGKW